MAEGYTAGGTLLPCPSVLLADERLIARFWAKVTKSGGPKGDCWEWQGRLRERGYAEFRLRKYLPMIRAHRLSFALHHGRWPDPALMLLHSCDNRRCVNPDHLREGTAAENQADVQERFYGRDRSRFESGVDRWRNQQPSDAILRGGSSLDPYTVRQIRAEVAEAGGVLAARRDGTAALLALDNDTTEAAILAAATGRTFAWVIGGAA